MTDTATAFILSHCEQHSETPIEFFKHWLEHTLGLSRSGVEELIFKLECSEQLRTRKKSVDGEEVTWVRLWSQPRSVDPLSDYRRSIGEAKETGLEASEPQAASDILPEPEETQGALPKDPIDQEIGLHETSDQPSALAYSKRNYPTPVSAVQMAIIEYLRGGTENGSETEDGLAKLLSAKKLKDSLNNAVAKLMRKDLVQIKISRDGSFSISYALTEKGRLAKLALR